MLIDYCSNNQYKIFDIYIDDGFSGLNFNRTGFQRLLNDIDAGKVDMVITKDLCSVWGSVFRHSIRHK